MDSCLECGLCLKICPRSIDLYDVIRHNSASGGVITTLIHTLLKHNDFDFAFLLDDYNYEKLLF